MLHDGRIRWHNLEGKGGYSRFFSRAIALMGRAKIKTRLWKYSLTKIELPRVIKKNCENSPYTVYIYECRVSWRSVDFHLLSQLFLIFARLHSNFFPYKKKLLLPGKAGGQAGRRAIKKMSDSARSWTASKLFYFKLRDIREGPFFKSSNSENASRNKKKRDTTSNRMLGLK